MADPMNTPTPMTNADINPPPADTGFQPAAPLKDAHTELEPDAADTADGNKTGGTTASSAGQAVKGGASKVGQQATEKLRMFADDGKARAGTALDQLSQMLTDAADQVDGKLGDQYGQYARNAAGQVQTFADSVRNKDVDEALEDVRSFVRQSPGVAIGTAAALGFVMARLVQSGLDNKA